jgi:hypothetical protein
VVSAFCWSHISALVRQKRTKGAHLCNRLAYVNSPQELQVIVITAPTVALDRLDSSVFPVTITWRNSETDRSK